MEIIFLLSIPRGQILKEDPLVFKLTRLILLGLINIHRFKLIAATVYNLTVWKGKAHG